MTTSHQHRCGDGCSHSHRQPGEHTHNDAEDLTDFLDESHPCCQKDAASRARALKIRSELDKVDPTQIAERVRREVGSTSRAIPYSMLPECRGQDYPALKEARRAAAKESRRSESFVDDRHRGDDDRGGDDESENDDLDYLLDDPELLRMENVRVEAMQAEAARLSRCREVGFGVHLEVPESLVEKTIPGQFRAAGVVAHFYDPDSTLGASLDLLLEKKAGSYMGTRFVRSRVRPGSAVASRIRVQRVPSLACYKGGVRVAYTEEMSQFGDGNSVDPRAVEQWLAATGTLEFDPPTDEALRDMAGKTTRLRNGDSVDDDDLGDGEEDSTGRRYDCGLEGCHKTFEHSHFLAEGGGGLPGDFEKRF